MLHQPGRRRRRGGLVHHPAGLGLGNQPDPGTVHLNGQLVQCRGDTCEPLVAGPPQLRRELGQLLDRRSQEPEGIQPVGFLTHAAFEHTSSLEHVSDNIKSFRDEYPCKHQRLGRMPVQTHCQSPSIPYRAAGDNTGVLAVSLRAFIHARSLTVSSAGAPSIQSVLSDDAQGNTRESRSKPDAANTTHIPQTRP